MDKIVCAMVIYKRQRFSDYRLYLAVQVNQIYVEVFSGCG